MKFILGISIGIFATLGSSLVWAQTPDVVCNVTKDDQQLATHRECCLRQFQKTSCDKHPIFLDCQHGTRTDGFAECQIKYGYGNQTVLVDIGFSAAEKAALNKAPAAPSATGDPTISGEIACYHSLYDLTSAPGDPSYPSNLLAVQGTYLTAQSGSQTGAYLFDNQSTTATFYPGITADSSSELFTQFATGGTIPTNGVSGLMNDSIRASLTATLSSLMEETTEDLDIPPGADHSAAQVVDAENAYLTKLEACKSITDAPADLVTKISSTETAVQAIITKNSGPTAPAPAAVVPVVPKGS